MRPSLTMSSRPRGISSMVSTLWLRVTAQSPFFQAGCYTRTTHPDTG